MFDFENSDDIQDGSTRIIKDVKLNEDKIKIVSYIKQNGSITNAMSRDVVVDIYDYLLVMNDNFGVFTSRGWNCTKYTNGKGCSIL